MRAEDRNEAEFFAPGNSDSLYGTSIDSLGQLLSTLALECSA